MKIGMSAIVSGLILASVCEAENIGDPFGVCAHLNRWEYSRMPEELELMRQAGIRNVRSDLDWKQVEPQKGKWDFRRWDSLFAEAERKNITVLPILSPAAVGDSVSPAPRRVGQVSENRASAVSRTEILGDRQ